VPWGAAVIVQCQQCSKVVSDTESCQWHTQVLRIVSIYSLKATGRGSRQLWASGGMPCQKHQQNHGTGYQAPG
jgi:hypothetical protein